MISTLEVSVYPRTPVDIITSDISGLALTLANSRMASGCRIWRGLSGQYSPKWLIRISDKLNQMRTNHNFNLFEQPQDLNNRIF